jgi:hydroxyacylglutathione hydrolase
MNDLETITLGDICICCMETPGHTEDHVSFVVTHVTPDSTKIPILFCADTLFIAGCGRLLGGTAT